jgi:hypothetical protein
VFGRLVLTLALATPVVADAGSIDSTGTIGWHEEEADGGQSPSKARFQDGLAGRAVLPVARSPSGIVIRAPATSSISRRPLEGQDTRGPPHAIDPSDIPALPAVDAPRGFAFTRPHERRNPRQSRQPECADGPDAFARFRCSFAGRR